VEGTNLYIMPAGSAVRNPLELLNMRPVRYTLDSFRKVFNWVILDTPPLLFSADANLLATITDGIILVVRIGSTTYDSVVRAIQTLCENNVLGIVANGARAGELYSKYTYYYSRSEGSGHEREDEETDEEPEFGVTSGPSAEKLASASLADDESEPVAAGQTHSDDAGAFVPSFGAEAQTKGGFFSRFRSRGEKPKKAKAPVEEDEAEDDDE
jgi:Mrp family chromosome partitioning ATPase